MLFKVHLSLVVVALISAMAIGVWSLHPASASVSQSDRRDDTVTRPLDSMAVLASGPYARNRIWNLFNHDCARTNNESPLEINMCVAMRRATSHQNRCRALGYLIDVGMISFPRARMDWMARGLASSPPDRVLYVTRLIATDNHRGRFLKELCNDEVRMTRFLNGQQITLE